MEIETYLSKTITTKDDLEEMIVYNLKPELLNEQLTKLNMYINNITLVGLDPSFLTDVYKYLDFYYNELININSVITTKRIKEKEQLEYEAERFYSTLF